MVQTATLAEPLAVGTTVLGGAALGKDNATLDARNDARLDNTIGSLYDAIGPVCTNCGVDVGETNTLHTTH